MTLLPDLSGSLNGKHRGTFGKTELHVAIQASLPSREISCPMHAGSHEVGGSLPKSAVRCCMGRRLADFSYATGSSGLN